MADSVKIKITGDDSAFRKTLGGLGSVTKSVVKGFALAGTAATALGGAIGAVGVKYNATIEQLNTSFEVMTGSAEKAASVTERLKRIGADTPYDLKGLAATTQLLMNYGFEANRAVDEMMMLGDIAQGNAEAMNSVALGYAQMSSLGKVNLQDIKQMINAGFNPLQEISERTGESMEKLYDRISKGTMAVSEITDSMKHATSEGGRYLHSKGWHVLRAKDSGVRKRLAEAMRRAVDNQNIGYDQWQRNTLWNVARLVGYDPARVMSPVETDCSALVRVCMAYAGVVVGDFRTIDQVKIVMASGAFDQLTDDKYTKRADYLMEGDILVTRTSGHTVIVLNDGDLAGSGDEQPATLTRPTIRRGSKGAAVKAAQGLLMAWDAKALPRYGADGDFGGETDTAARSFQRAHKLAVDGIIGPKTWAALDKYGASKTVVIKPGTWNVRSGPGTEHPPVGAHANGGETYPHVSTAANGWNEIMRDGARVWVSGLGSEVK